MDEKAVESDTLFFSAGAVSIANGNSRGFTCIMFRPKVKWLKWQQVKYQHNREIIRTGKRVSSTENKSIKQNISSSMLTSPKRDFLLQQACSAALQKCQNINKIPLEVNNQI